MARAHHVVFLLAGLCWLSACGTLPREETTGAAAEPAAASRPAAAQRDARDPLEGFNRAMYTFNEKFDKYLLKPVAQGYRAVVPAFARQGIANFFRNLGEPVVAVNNLLQGKFKEAGTDLLRLVINTTLGLAGLFDPASAMGLEKHDEDFGQTLAVWGVGEGPYLVLPIFGPSTLRDAFGLAVDYNLYPPTHMEETSTRDKLSAANLVSRRAQLLDATDILEQAGGEDPYVFVREFYRQRRRNQIFDGTPPMEAPSFLFDEAGPPAPAGTDGAIERSPAP
jgi:phospholipid-binding lipoprotein MlaA